MRYITSVSIPCSRFPHSPSSCRVRQWWRTLQPLFAVITSGWRAFHAFRPLANTGLRIKCFSSPRRKLEFSYVSFAFVRLHHCVVECVKKWCGSYVFLVNDSEDGCKIHSMSIVMGHWVFVCFRRIFIVSQVQTTTHRFQAIQSHPLQGGDFSDKWAYFYSFCRSVSKSSKGTVTRYRLCNSFPTFVISSAIKVDSSWITCWPLCRHVIRDGQPCFRASARYCKPVPVFLYNRALLNTAWNSTYNVNIYFYWWGCAELRVRLQTPKRQYMFTKNSEIHNIDARQNNNL